MLRPCDFGVFHNVSDVIEVFGKTFDIVSEIAVLMSCGINNVRMIQLQEIKATSASLALAHPVFKLR